MAYDYIHQPIVATCLIEPKDDDSFYFPVANKHYGFAADGTYYVAGVQQSAPLSPPLSPPLSLPIFASWYSEAITGSPYRGDSAAFPQAGLVLLSRVSLTILDETSTNLTMWMQFLIQNNIIDPDASPPITAGSYAFTDNFNSNLNGWTPAGLTYADGVLSIIYSPDYGNESGVVGPNYNVDSNMALTIDFCQDLVYLDVAVIAPPTSPVFTPPQGVYSSTQEVTLSDETPGALIYYTLDGSTPSPPSGLYTSPLTISATTTVTALAVTNGGVSDTSEAVYTIT